MKTRTKIFWSGLALLLALGLVGIGNALAAVSTDQGDYIPGSVVTVSGDNSDGAGYLAGETVHVDVSGPNGYVAACDAVADDAGAWSCQVTLAGDESAIGDYAYTAIGQASGVVQSGVFTDTPPASPTPTNLNIPLNNDKAEVGTECPIDGNAYWHFVISPNNGHSSFITFHLNLGDPGTYDTSIYIKNGTQTDNVFVAVPSGYLLTSLKKDGSTADIIWDSKGSTPDKFQLSHVCPGAGVQDLTVTKTATPSYTRTFDWTIDKSADKDTVYSAGGGESEPVNFTVSVTKTGYTDSDFAISGFIYVYNPNSFAVNVTGVSDSLDGATVDCGVTFPYGLAGTSTLTCTYSASVPDKSSGTNTATATWDSKSASGSVDYVFGDPTTKVYDTIHVIDTNGQAWDFSDTGSKTYPITYTDPAGTCTPHENTATIDQTGQTTDPVTVTDCQGADLIVTKDATPTFTRTYNWDISKGVDPKLVEQIGGTATFNYTIKVWGTGYTDSEWAVSGNIHVYNPNDWEAITFDASDAISDSECAVTGGTGVEIAAGASIDLPYTCTFAEKPAYNTDLTNTATATWDSAAYHTPDGLASGTATFQFTTPTTEVNKTVTVKDNFNGTETTLGTVDYPGPGVFNYSHTVNVPTWNCVYYDNTATIVETGQSASQRVEVCGPAKTGALTMGFWQNKNGQAIITGGASTAGVCNSAPWLRQYTPFQDLNATATCAQVGTYVTNVIKAANASGAAMNAMLKGQMLATALDVYFSDPALGGNMINAPTPIGGVAIDLTKVCKNIGGGCTTFEDVSSAFGGATSLTVSQMLAYAASQSNSGGSDWYGQVKATQELAKDAFDAINNQKVFAP